jgi:hypothetical protein
MGSGTPVEGKGSAGVLAFPQTKRCPGCPGQAVGDQVEPPLLIVSSCLFIIRRILDSSLSQKSNDNAMTPACRLRDVIASLDLSS